MNAKKKFYSILENIKMYWLNFNISSVKTIIIGLFMNSSKVQKYCLKKFLTVKIAITILRCMYPHILEISKLQEFSLIMEPILLLLQQLKLPLKLEKINFQEAYFNLLMKQQIHQMSKI